MPAKAREAPPFLEAEFSQLASIHFRPRPLNLVFVDYNQWFEQNATTPTNP